MPIKKNLKSEVLASYDEKRELYADLSKTVSQLVQTLLFEENVIFHSITSRCKDRQSLEAKLSRPGKAYQRLEQITDVAGIRLTTYFADDVDRVAEILRREFDIDTDASVDKRVQSDPDRFGYVSLHYIAQLAGDRVQLREYRRYANLKFELQIRSILQHAWAEIEHDLGYKSASGVPAEVRRRFARISGLLELADAEFCAIRTQLSSYERILPALIQSKPEDSEIDLPTLKLLVEKDEDVSRLDTLLAQSAGAIVEGVDSDSLAAIVDRLKFFNITKVNQLKGAARAEAENVRKFASYWVDDGLDHVNSGIGLFYLCYVLAWKSGNRSLVLAYLNQANIDLDENREHIAGDIIAFDPNFQTSRR